jgi:hypothetical protein
MADGEDAASHIPGSAPPPRSERARLIGELAAAAKATHFAPLRGRYEAAPVIELPEALLLYRVENGRLIAEIEEHARRQGVDLGRLRAEQETLAVQQLLHRFLADKAASPEGPILQELAEQGQQVEPLLISADGVLINGNRRMAAMRTLLARDPKRYAGFSAVSAAVLPAEVTAAEIEAAEAALQMAPETKLAYGWINRRLKLRRQRQDLGLSDQEIQQAYRLPEAGRIEVELGELALAEEYLERFARAPHAYSLIADAEPLFVGLYAQLSHMAPSQAELWKLAGMVMIAGRAAIQGPFDRQFPFADAVPGRLPLLALRRLAEEQGLTAEDGEDEATPLDKASREQLARILSDPGRAEHMAGELHFLMERVRAQLQDLTSPARALQLLQKLRDTLARMDPDKLTPGQRKQMQSEVAAILAKSAVLFGDEQGQAAIGRLTALGGLGRLLAGKKG